MIRRFLINHNFHIPYFFLFSFFFYHLVWAQGMWQTKTDMPTARASASAATIDGKIYVMGGIESGVAFGEPASAIVEIYDPVTDSWDTSSAGPMPVGKNSYTTAVVNNKIYVIGGQSTVGTTNLSSVYEYDPQTDEWTAKKPMPDERAGLSSGVVNGKIYLVGGYNLYPNSWNVYHLAKAWEYDPVIDEWDTTKAALNVPREYLTASVVDGRIYAFGGWDDAGTVFRTAEMYDPETDEWKLLPDMDEERVYLKSGAINNKIYLFGGSTLHSVPPKSDTWEYDPVSNTYRDVTSMPIGMMHGAASTAHAKIYWFGGFEEPLHFPGTMSAKVFEFTPPITRNVPADYPTIQAAIDSSSDGDRVLVADGTYSENINFKGKKITVGSHYYIDGDTSHINNTIINGSQPSNPDSGSVVYFISGEDTTSVLTGFTITGGTGTVLRVFPDWWQSKSGAGIFVLWSGAKIQNNKITNNNISVSGDTASNGTAIVGYGELGDYLIIRDNLINKNHAESEFITLGTVQWGMKEHTVFEGNIVTENSCHAPNVYGGGLLLYGQAGWQGLYVVRNNIIKDNILDGTSAGSGGGIHIGNCAPDISNNIISGNEAPAGGGIAINQWDNSIGTQKPKLINNTIINNSAVTSGGGIYIDGSEQPAIKVLNNIIWGNSAPDGPQISVPSGSITIHYSNVQGGDTVGGNINTDPMLEADSLADDSKCIGAGILEYEFDDGVVLHSPLTDINGRVRPFPYGSNPDIGARESILGADEYQLVWSDEFDGTELNLTKWGHEIGDGSSNGIPGWGNNELEYYRSENTIVDSGFLIITAKEESFGGRSYTSSRLRSLNKGDWKYGKFELRAKMPLGKGLWPAIWMMPSKEVYGDWAASGEIDIMEYLGHEENKVHGTIHFGGSWPNNVSSGLSYTLDIGNFHEEFHVFSLIWEEERLIWLVDGQPYQTQTSWWSSGGIYPAPFDQEFHMILNLAVGGDWPGAPDETTEFPQEFIIDYVRVYQKKISAITNLETTPVNIFLHQNYPNPFNPSTTIEFSIPKTEFVTVKIYNLLGQEVETLVAKKLNAGSYKYDWDAGKLASGIYMYRLEAGDFGETKKMVLIK